MTTAVIITYRINSKQYSTSLLHSFNCSRKHMNKCYLELKDSMSYQSGSMSADSI